MTSCSPSGRRFEQREAFATPMSDRGDDRLGQRAFHGPLHARVVAWSEQTTMAQRERGEGDVHGKLRLECMTEIGAGGARRNVRMAGEESPLFGGCRFSPGRAG